MTPLTTTTGGGLVGGSRHNPARGDDPMSDGDVLEVKMVRRSRATGGRVLLPGKTYPVSKDDFMDLVRSGKGVDPTGKVRIAPPKSRTSTAPFGEEAPSGKGESTQTVASSSPKKDAEEAAAKADKAGSAKPAGK